MGSRQLTWEHMAHRKLRQKPCAHTKQKHKHMASKTNHQPCAKQDTNTQLMRTLISRVHTRHDNMKARSQWNTRAACHTAQDITWMHAADKNTNCVQHHTHNTRGQESARPSELEPHAQTMRQNMEREYPNPDTKPKLKTWVPGSEHHAPTQNKARRRESARLEHTRSRTLTWKQDMTGVSGLCHKTMNNTILKWQNPDTTPPQKGRQVEHQNEEHQKQDRNMTAQEHDYTRLIHNNRQDKKNLNTKTKRGAREGGEPSQPTGQPRNSLKGWLTGFFLGLIVFMGCSLTCVHASFFLKMHYFSHNLHFPHRSVPSLTYASIISCFYEAPPSEIRDGLWLVSWLSVLWFAKPPSVRLNIPPLTSAACAPVVL